MGTNAVITLLSGGTVTADKLFVQAEFQDKISISFKKNEDEFEQILTELDELFPLLITVSVSSSLEPVPGSPDTPLLPSCT